MNWEQVDQSPRPTGTDSDLKALSPFLRRPGVLSASNFSNTGSSPRHRALGVGVADTGWDARTLSLQLKQSQKVRQGSHLSLSIDAVPHQLPRDLDHCLLQGPHKEGQRPQPGLAPPRHFPPPTTVIALPTPMTSLLQETMNGGCERAEASCITAS